MVSNEAPVYWTWGADNIAYGPVELPALISWIRDERVVASSWVIRDDDKIWRRASEQPDLIMFFKSGTTESRTVVVGPTAQHLKPAMLRRIKVFAEMEENQIVSFCKYMEIIRVRQFVPVVSAGESGDAMYLVLDGELRARVMLDGKESTLAIIQAGEFFGEISLLDHGPRSADVVANAESVLLKIPLDAFEKIVKEAPALALPFFVALSRTVVSRLRHMSKRYEDTVHFARTAGGNVKPDPADFFL